MLRRLLASTEDQRLASPAGRKDWELWCKFACSVNQDPYLADKQGASHYLERKHLFLAFATALREGSLNGGKPASGSAIERTLRYCGQVLADRGFADPRRRDVGQNQLDREFSRLFRQYKDGDDPVVRQQAIPSHTVEELATHALANGSTKDKMVGALAVVAFFFLLRVGEYTPSGGVTRTVPLRKGDVKLWRGTTLLNNDADYTELCSADAVTITLENQKNGNKGDTLHHSKAGGSVMCPVKAMAWIMCSLQGKPGDTPLGTYWDEYHRRRQVNASDMRMALRAAAARSGLEAKGYDLSRIGNHSLRSGGAVALKLAGYDSDVIKKLGRWSSNTYLIYIQSQIAQLTEGIATSMSQRLTLHNVG